MALVRGPISLRWSVALLACGVAGSACASLAGLTGGTDAEAKKDGVDGGSDARAGDARAADARTGDATTRDALEASPPDGANDATADGTTDAEDAHRADAMPDAASDALPDGCVPFLIPDAGSAVACAPHDGNACNPSVPGFTPVWRPPLHEVACSTPQVIEYVAACFGPDATAANCTAFTEDAMNAACYQCMFTNDRTSTKLGPIINESGIDVYSTNGAGCVALVDPCQIDCAKAIDAARECLEEACSNCAAATPDWYACQTEAASCSCLAYESAATACTNALSTRPVDMDCFANVGFATFAQAYGIFFCAGGPLVLDAGADGG